MTTIADANKTHQSLLCHRTKSRAGNIIFNTAVVGTVHNIIIQFYFIFKQFN